VFYNDSFQEGKQLWRESGVLDKNAIIKIILERATNAKKTMILTGIGIIVIGAIAGYATYHYVGCTSRNCHASKPIHFIWKPNGWFTI
jgi:hypothetical protein